MANPHIFLEHFVWTVDTHDKRNPIKQLPAERPHMHWLTELWMYNPLLAICKSRQMMMTWLFCALALWDVLAHNGRQGVFFSKCGGIEFRQHRKPPHYLLVVGAQNSFSPHAH